MKRNWFWGIICILGAILIFGNLFGIIQFKINALLIIVTTENYWNSYLSICYYRWNQRKKLLQSLIWDCDYFLFIQRRFRF